ncbi:hypothetical protein [Polyangium sorediatum]|uniref:Uncharacterized protein n=1 Tax=Polyangium sorediatum TaxID=889274 RepID=A0ABT6NP22_9BACT|nr:hypothetical protein [Polyangium sorediatum]MDI1430077.1 hypothetical protein [Polyangium sorediatum]
MGAPNHYRSAGGEPRTVRVLDFDRLPDVVRERLVRALEAGGMPAPLLRVEESAAGTIPGSQRFWRGTGIVAAFVWLGLWFVQFGDLDGPFSVQPRAFVLGHVLVASLLALVVIVHVFFRRSKDEGAPFPSGRYLFLLDLVEVRGRILTVTSLATLRRVEGRAGGKRGEVLLVFGDGDAAPLRISEDVTETARQVQAAIDEAARLILPDDQPEIERIDPFFELRISDDWASAAPVAKETGGRVPAFRWIALVSVAAGALLGSASWFARNHASDTSMFGQVREAAERGEEYEFARRHMLYKDLGMHHREELDELAFEHAKKRPEWLAEYLTMAPEGKHAVEADDLLFDMVMKADSLPRYRLYLGDARGRRHVHEVDDAMFAEAKRSNTRYAYQEYLDAHGTKHEHEVRSTFLPKAEIADAMQKQDVAELRAIERRYGSGWTQAVTEAIHHAYADRLDLLRLRKGAGADEARAIFQPLLTWLDTKEDPRVLLDVTIVLSNSFLESETAFRNEHGDRYQSVGTVFPRFAASVEDKVFITIVTRARDRFGGAIRFQSPTAEKGTPELPRLVVRMRLEAGNEPFVSRNDKLVFCDVRIRLEMHAEIPGADPTPSFVTTSPRSETIRPDSYDASMQKLDGVLGTPKNLIEDAYPIILQEASGELGTLLVQAF